MRQAWSASHAQQDKDTKKYVIFLASNPLRVTCAPCSPCARLRLLESAKKIAPVLQARIALAKMKSPILTLS